MPNDTTTHWTVSVFRDTDIAVRPPLEPARREEGRTFPAHRGCGAWWRRFDPKLAQARSRFTVVPLDELEALIDQALAAVRADAAIADG